MRSFQGSTVPRAELTALVVALTSVRRNARLEMVSDAQTICDSYALGEDGPWRSADNSDLWVVLRLHSWKRTTTTSLR